MIKCKTENKTEKGQKCTKMYKKDSLMHTTIECKEGPNCHEQCWNIKNICGNRYNSDVMVFGHLFFP